MKILEKEIKTNGFIYKQITRNDKYAIYSQENMNYEVIEIKLHPKRIIFGKTYLAGEYYPITSEWGNYGWSYQTLEEARKKYDYLTSTIHSE